MLTPADVLPRLEQVCVLGATHADYARTLHLATLYRKLATGDISSLLRQFSRLEDEGQFETREKMTIETVSASWNQLRTPFYEVARKRGGDVTKRFDYAPEVAPPEAQRRQARLSYATGRYYNQQPVEHYLAQQLSKSHLMSDPNAWLLTVFAPFDANTQVAQPYPVLIPCEHAVDFTRQAGTVASFTVRLAIAQSATDYRYCCYLDNQAVDCWPVLYDEETATPTLPEGSPVFYEMRERLPTDMGPATGKLLYQCRLLTHKAGVVPARCLGYVVDEAGTGESFVSPLHAALPFLIGMLKVGSENDIVMAQMAFPVRARYAKDCPGQGTDDYGVKHVCVSGLDMPNMAPCPVCGGTGETRAPITAAVGITLPYPKPNENTGVKPADAMAFIGPPTDNPKLQLDYLQSRRLLAMQAVHGTEDADRVAGSETATQRRLRQKAQQVALSPCADQLASLYQNAVLATAGYTDTAQGLSLVYSIQVIDPESEDELYEQRLNAVKAGADASTLEAIDARIAYRQYADDPEALLKNQVKRRFITFLGYSDAWVTQQATLGYISAYDRVARTHADIIFGELETEVTDFYHLADAAQAPKVAKKITDILAKLPVAGVGSGTFPKLVLSAPAAPAAPVAV